MKKRRKFFNEKFYECVLTRISLTNELSRLRSNNLLKSTNITLCARCSKSNKVPSRKAFNSESNVPHARYCAL